MTCFNNPDRFSSYWSEYASNDYFYTGDVAMRDKDGYYTVLGRSDDVINVSGVRISTAEVEGALVSHEYVSEAAVIGVADELKGEVINAFVVLNHGVTMSPDLEKELRRWVRDKISYIAEPTKIESVTKLPKTRSGKIMRRILKAKQMGLSIGDTSTLDD
jgi:acetyl-CoA synthetase